MSRPASIRTIRAVARALAASPELLGKSAGALRLGLVRQTVPMAGFSPFESLAREQRDDAVATNEASSGGRSPAPELQPLAREEPQVASVGMERRPIADPPLVFSFRRPAQGVPEFRDAAQDGANGAPFGAAVASSRAADESLDRTSRASARLPNLPALGDVESPGLWDGGAVAASSTAKTIDLLDALTSKLLRVPEGADSGPSVSDAPFLTPVGGGAATALWVEAERTTPGVPPLLPPRNSRSVSEAAGAGRVPVDVYAPPGAVALSIQSDGAPDMPSKPLTRQGGTAAWAPGNGRDTDLDAETVTSMVNEVLSEQARRHGVDLS